MYLNALIQTVLNKDMVNLCLCEYPIHFSFLFYNLLYLHQYTLELLLEY